MNLAVQLGQYFSDYVTSWQITFRRIFMSNDSYVTALSPYLKSHFFEPHEHVLLVVQAPIIGYNDELVKYLILHLLESEVGSVILAAGDVQGCIDIWNEMITEVTRDPRVFVQPIRLHEPDHLERFVQNHKMIRKSVISYLICLESPYLPVDASVQITKPSRNLISKLHQESLFSSNFKLIFVTNDLWLLMRKNLIVPMMHSYTSPFVPSNIPVRPFVSYFTGPSCLFRIRNMPRLTDHSPYSLGLLLSWLVFMGRILLSSNPVVSSASVIDTLKTQGLLNGQNLVCLHEGNK